jgi:hypothetical protein
MKRDFFGIRARERLGAMGLATGKVTTDDVRRWYPGLDDDETDEVMVYIHRELKDLSDFELDRYEFLAMMAGPAPPGTPTAELVEVTRFTPKAYFRAGLGEPVPPEAEKPPGLCQNVP